MGFPIWFDMMVSEGESLYNLFEPSHTPQFVIYSLIKVEGRYLVILVFKDGIGIRRISGTGK